MSKKDIFSGLRSAHNDLFSNERGIVLVLLAIIGVVFIAFSALTIDLSKQMLHMREMKDASDAAAHAMALELDGTKEGWLRAKRAGVTVLRNYSLISLTGRDEGVIGSNFNPKGLSQLGADDTWESSGIYKGVQWRDGRVTVNLERGWVGIHENEETGQVRLEFVSFEKPDEKRFHLPKYITANAARAEISYASGLEGVFGKALLGPGFLRGGHTFSVAAYDTIYNDDAAPFAVPLCELFFNPNKDSYGYDDEEYRGDKQCFRDVLVTDARALIPRIDDTKANYRQGRNRWSYYKPYLFFERDGLPKLETHPYLIGAMGTFSPVHADWQTSAESVTSIDQFLTELNKGGDVVTIGSQFRPVQYGTETDCTNDRGIHCKPGPFDKIFDLSSDLAEYIKNSSQTFGSKFPYDPESCHDKPGLLSKCPYLSAYPWPFLSVHELLLQSQEDYPQGRRPEPWWIWMEANPDRSFTSPLCHAWGYDSGLEANNPNTHKVRTVSVAAVVPKAENATYCPWQVDQAKKENKRLELVPMGPETEPVVVGNVDATFVDFNFSRLTDSDIHKPEVGVPDTVPGGFLPWVPRKCADIPSDVLAYLDKFLDVTNIRKLVESYTGRKVPSPLSPKGLCDMLRDPSNIEAMFGVYHDGASGMFDLDIFDEEATLTSRPSNESCYTTYQARRRPDLTWKGGAQTYRETNIIPPIRAFPLSLAPLIVVCPAKEFEGDDCCHCEKIPILFFEIPICFQYKYCCSKNVPYKCNFRTDLFGNEIFDWCYRWNDRYRCPVEKNPIRKDTEASPPESFEDYINHGVSNFPEFHCLPDASVKPVAMADMQPQHGCGGLQARLECKEKALAGPNTREQSRPILLDVTAYDRRASAVVETP